MSQKIALFFPGQGSQSVGMLSELLASSDIVKATFAEASEALGYDLAELVLNGPEEELNQTHRTQPALLTASVAIFRAWQEKGVEAELTLAGHSLGEYSALVCAEVLTLADAVKLVEKRGLYMQEAVPAGTGSMAAIIGLDDDVIAKVCAESAQGDVVSPVNYNSPGQVVIAGHVEAVNRASEACKEAGAKRALPLAVSVPSHCALMKPAADKLAKDLEALAFSEPKFDVINNVDVAVAKDAAAIKDALIRQLYSPVRWTETVQAVAKEGVTTTFEFGPGKVISGLVKRIDRSVSCVSVNDLAAIAAAE
ncbi:MULTISPECIES: ACP S-malonyltransferase [Pseudoalteromonas]|uniref:Malonyl CoA-acyl carrier protein transacylase n=1 Tax=Pseudoalteromonas maricaloris TaxID=184924 RepID=A0A8I2H4V1_9GAMM|nr:MULTISPECIES: ACP S-malonyltransferase [Pseudoalteromonas]KID33235.1 malonyl CoA-ACP transacylase [Pseudoalteromonas flavipulchra NCIMB 2033 = ATCC BAA-314]MBD0781763.1 ACP S-malonyltransferase [Pseudoalteromonas flavipulchra]MBE0373209.1 [acyl-carrier-protein] S-malonyltransferase [Pseudoalteromonas flavipulchra NCIMB 2033 = ATCC BAA-314]MCO7198782.1 ACP S-malonyltransferase [Pseudoalteromonas sp. OANN1]NLR20251.1 ACP S-malonyltransferase [Pseudoalteromonas maricaloris]